VFKLTEQQGVCQHAGVVNRRSWHMHEVASAAL
jgi:hypothetical protein